MKSVFLKDFKNRVKSACSPIIIASNPGDAIPGPKSLAEKEKTVPIKPSLTELEIPTAEGGFYNGFAKDVTITAKLLVGALIVWAVAFPEGAGAFLGEINSFILARFNGWYIYVMAFYLLVCLTLAAIPATGKIKLGCKMTHRNFRTSPGSQ